MIPVLLIKMNNGKIYRARLPMHFMVVEHHNLDFDEIADVGVLTNAGSVLWMGRKPH